jgi:hypothetical protein
VTISQDLRSRNPGNVELGVAVALALMGRGDAHVHFARRQSRVARHDGLGHAERDYGAAVALLSKLQQDGAIGGTDVTSLENGRRELERIRAELKEVAPR